MVPPDPSLHSVSPRTNRSHSISSDRPSLTGSGVLLCPPRAVDPEPAFIAASAASQIVTNDHDSQADAWFEQHGIEPSGETALVAPAALKLVNRFLDQLLFNFLSIGRSTSLAALRPAVGEVLKPKLAQGAISGADQELHEYLGGGGEEELLAYHHELEPDADWDLELVWKRTRLRCMVYSSLGDMEEEDEDFYTLQDHLDGPGASQSPASRTSDVVSPAVAIFLTSILEFMGEQVLLVAGQAAYHRIRARHDREDRDRTGPRFEIAERVVVEEADVERVAMDRTLGRLWRGWKKRVRTPNASLSMSRSFSRESLFPPVQDRPAASASPPDHAEESHPPSIAAVLAADEYAAGIPLPISDDDIREIEIPGLAQQIDDEEDEEREEEAVPQKQRPRSLILSPFHAGDGIPTPTSTQPNTPLFLAAAGRRRSQSLPSPPPSTYTSPSSQHAKNDTEEIHADRDIAEDPATDDASGAQMATRTHEQQGEEADREKDQLRESPIPMAGTLSGAAAMGATAVAGITAAVNGPAAQTDPSRDVGTEAETEAEEEFGEEPEILTSSRVSIGRSGTPDEPKIPSRQASVRASSVHSIRIIDVASPRSPAGSRSRSGSADASDYISGRPAVGLHTPSDGPPPRLASPVSRGPTSSPLIGAESQTSSRHPRSSVDYSISEEKEAADVDSTALPADVGASSDLGEKTVSHASFVPPTTGRDVAPRASAFVLSAPPIPRKARGNSNEVADEPPVPHATSNLGGGSKAEGSAPAPPLTPLREQMEGAPEAVDGASSIAPRQDDHSMPPRSLNGHSPTLSGSSSAKNQRDSPKSVRPQAATIPRSSPPRSSSSREDLLRREQAKRPIHTSGSGSGSSSASHKLKPVRTSEESSLRGVEDKGQSFEQLIRSDQTLQYTLTPPNMRNIEGLPESPRFTAPAAILHPQDGPLPRRSHSLSVSKYTGLHSNPPLETSRPAHSAKVPNTGARLRRNAPEPRDARVNRESIGDLADFISSTAPPGANEPPSFRSAPTVNGHRGTRGTARNVSGSAPRASAVSSLPRRAESSAGRPKLQARDAAVPRGDSISDLIDFVRSGPQLDKEAHRIPRTVAPFRNTMDSDEMSGAVGGKAIDATLPDPRYSQASASLNSSINSQSPLISSTTKANRQFPVQGLANLDDDHVIPKRKQRRVRDMYQIDLSDEEDDVSVANPRTTAIKEESLAEFLANVPPPPDSSPAPLFLAAATAGSIKKKTSSPSLMARFGRKDPVSPPLPKPNSSGQDARSMGSRRSQLPSHTPIAVQFSSNKPTTYEPSRGPGRDYVSQLDTARNKVAPMPYLAREAQANSARTSELASFLRSEPPTSTSTQSQTLAPTLQKEEAGTFQRMFGRKKVH